MNNTEKNLLQQLHDELNRIQSINIKRDTLEAVCYDTKRAIDTLIKEKHDMTQHYIDGLKRVK